jgi:hypothetical protein
LVFSWQNARVEEKTMANSEAVQHEIATAPQLGPMFGASVPPKGHELAERVAVVAGQAERTGAADQLSLLGQLFSGASKDGIIKPLAGLLSYMSVDTRFGEALGILGPNKELTAIDFVGAGPNIVRCDAAKNWSCEAVPNPHSK